MRCLSCLFVVSILLVGCSKNTSKVHVENEQFKAEIITLKDYFEIPGLAVSIEKDGETIYRDHLGYADNEAATPLDSSYLFPIASITKVFTGVLVMKLVEDQRLSLDDPVNAYLDNSTLGDSILVKHILSHTSQGNVGKEFYYSSRFGLLTQVIERASGKSFEMAMSEEIFRPLSLQNTFLLKDESQLKTKQKQLVKPYILDDGIKEGFIDFGFSASAGIVSNLDDLALFNKALDENSIISKASKNTMFSSFNKDLPYAYGIFNKKFKDLNLVWAYGQYDCYSSLFLKIPEQHITLTILANNNLMSDPARLIYGDAMSSLFVLSFLKNYVYKIEGMPLFENTDSNAGTPDASSEFYRKKLLAEALSESFMARFDADKLQSSATLLHKVFEEHPNYLDYADLNLLHNLSFLKDIAFYMELGDFNDFDTHIIKIGEKLLSLDPNNPYVNVYLGTFYDRNGDIDKARYYFKQIRDAENFSRNWYTVESENWLKNNP